MGARRERRAPMGPSPASWAKLLDIIPTTAKRINVMKCPACFNELTQLQVGKVTIDACQDGCGGIWFDNFELQQVDDETETAGECLMEVRRDPKVIVDFS